MAAHAQNPPTPTLREALDAAWLLSPSSRAAASRQAELKARGDATRSWLAGSPSATLAHRTDRLQANGGMREYEAEIALPLWNPGMRDATRRQVESEGALLDRQGALARLRLAGELRESAGQVATLQAEHDAATRKLDEATRLAADTGRRVMAGDSPRVDQLQAQAAVSQASSQVTKAGSALLKAHGQWRALTGLAAVPALDDAPGAGGEHPALLAARAQVRTAQARLALAEADRRDPMEVGVGITRERAAAGATGETTMRMALRIPFGGDARNAARLAAARAELDAAEAEGEAAQRLVDAGIAAARGSLAHARRHETLAAERAALAAQVQALIARAHELGEADLPGRMRADNDRYDADLALARARIETRRAIAQLNQALGVLP